MYESFFNLSSKPFDLLPDPRFIYLSRSYKKAMTYLNYGIRERSGFILLTGEVGSGKTTLIRDLLDKSYEHVVLSKIFNTRVTSEQLLSMINDDFGLDVQGKDKITMIRDLNVFLIDQYAAGNQPILIIDEAQNLSSDLLEEVRMLSNLEASSSKLMQIILVGQPELRTILAAPELRQLRQRININCHLQALSREEVEQYIGHRLEVAGNATAVHFEPESLDAIFRYSRGIPRLINIICDFLMFLAFAEETTILTVDMVSDVIGDLDFENYHWLEGTDTDAHNANGFSSVVDNPDVEKELQRILADIMRLIKSIEYEIATPLQNAINSQNDRLTSFQAAVASHITKTNTDISDLHKILEELCNSVTRNEKGTLQETIKSVFTVFGSDRSTHRK
ncbi:MAG: XrtA-associated ATPase [Desulfuromonadaceae bacterium]|nr:XrtA-associated ATPase [Desulfuromonadaceae bacterium]